MNENLNNNKPKINVPRPNLTWLYIVIAAVFAYLLFTSDGGSASKEVTYTEFKDMVSKGYASKITAYRHLEHAENYKLVTALAPSEYQSVDEIKALGVQVKVIPSKHTVYFENTYGENQDNRTQRVLAKADPFAVEHLKDEEARYFHLGSLLSDDFPLELVKYLSGKGILSVDAQGYLREVRGEKVFAVDWTEKLEALKYIDILKVNEHEAEVITGYTDPKQAAIQLAGNRISRGI